MWNFIHSNHLEDLADITFDLIGQAPLSPWQNELFLVHSQGMARWLQLSYAKRFGVAAMMDCLLPASFVWRAYRAVLSENLPQQSPFSRQILVWRLMQLLPSLTHITACKPLTDYLQQAVVKADFSLNLRCYQLAEQLANLFDQYLVYRPDWLISWQQGEDHGISLNEHQKWQPIVWRALLENSQLTDLAALRTTVHQHFLQVLQQTTKSINPALPERLFVFGISALPPVIIETLQALSEHIDITLLLTNPCRYYWGDMLTCQDERRQAFNKHQQKQKSSFTSQEYELADSNPLLASWGKQGRDFLQLLYNAAEQTPLAHDINYFRDWQQTQDAPLLQQLQQTILDFANPATHAAQTNKRLLRADDHSLRFVASYSPLREIEVLHDLLLADFSADPSLKPSDILVMVPNIDSYVAFIEAVFNQYSHEDQCFIPFVITDRHICQTDPLIQCFLALVNLPKQRFEWANVVDWLNLPALQHRFQLNEEKLSTGLKWLKTSGVRWGLSAAQRQTLNLPALATNSWQFGLERLLLGYAMGKSNTTVSTLATIEPFAVHGLNAQLVGLFSEFVATCDFFGQLFAQPATALQWLERLEALMNAFFAPQNEAEESSLAQIYHALQTLQQEFNAAQFNQLLDCVTVYQLVSDRLNTKVGSANLLMGRVTFATLLPMRAIPFRRIYLLGLNDGNYPRPARQQDFDLMLQLPRAGDRTINDDDRYLMLDALLAARENLTISWIGFDQRTNQSLAPSVLVSELWDVINSGWQDQSNEPLLPRLVTYHPLQPFAKRYFNQQGSWFSYDQKWIKQNQQILFASDDLNQPSPVPAIITNADLLTLWRKPYAIFLEKRLNTHFKELHIESYDTEPFVIKGLQSWQIKQKLWRKLADESIVDSSDSAIEIQRQLKKQLVHLSNAGELPFGEFGLSTTAPWLGKLTEQILQRHQLMAGKKQLSSCLWYLQTETFNCQFAIPNVFIENNQYQLISLEIGTLKKFTIKNKQITQLQNPRRLFNLCLNQLISTLNYQRPVSAWAIFEDQTIFLPAIELSFANAYLDRLLSNWQMAWQSPLPAVLDLSMALLLAYDETEGISQAQQKFTALTENKFHTQAAISQYSQEPAIRELWSDFAHLLNAGFVQQSKAIYQDLLTQLTLARVENSKLNQLIDTTEVS